MNPPMFSKSKIPLHKNVKIIALYIVCRQKILQTITITEQYYNLPEILMSGFL